MVNMSGIPLTSLNDTLERCFSATWTPGILGIIVAIENPNDIIVASQRPYGSRAVLKFSASAVGFVTPWM